MTTKELKEIITGGKEIPSFLIFIEEDSFNATMYLKLIAKTKYLPIEYCDSADYALYDMESPFYDPKIYYIANDESLLKNDLHLSQLKSCESMVIVAYDSQKRFDIKYKNDIVVFSHGNTEDICKYLNKKFPNVIIDDNKMKSMIESCNNDLNVVVNEMEKISVLPNTMADEYFSKTYYPNYKTIDDMTVMFNILNKNKDIVNYIKQIENGSVRYLKALYTMARNKLIATNNSWFAKIMICAYKALNDIVITGVDSKNVMDKFILELM